MSDIKSLIENFLDASTATKTKDIQALWSGYGAISRYQIEAGSVASVVVKHVQLPDKASHPRGWNTDFSHQRKVRSYQVECDWYEEYSNVCDSLCRVPHCYGTHRAEGEFLIIMEDLDQNGFALRKDKVSIADMRLCLTWLANFHAQFMHTEPKGLWQQGTYWHLATRPDELEALDDLALKRAAQAIDLQLESTPYKTLVHGDAKLANFCFSSDSKNVAAVDFQYVGGGCGMKDVAYFIGSCLYEEDCARYENELLQHYFTELRTALNKHHPTLNAKHVEDSWRALFPYAWTDFHRFMKGWSPGHWKINGYSESLARNVLQDLQRLSQ